MIRFNDISLNKDDLVSNKEFNFDLEGFLSKTIKLYKLWKVLLPNLNEVLNRKGLMQRRLINRIRSNAHKSMLYLETDSFVAESRVDFSTPLLAQSMSSRPQEGAVETLTHRYNGKKSVFHITAFNPHILHKIECHHYLYFSKKGPNYLITEHLFDRMLEREPGFKNSLAAKLTLLSQISNRSESLKGYWFGKENQIVIKSSIGAYLGEAIIVDKIQYYWLKTYLSKERLSQKLVDPWKWKKLDTLEIVSMEKDFIQKANGLPFNDNFI